MDIVDIVALFIALVALVVAIWQGVVMRRHNRLSVKPHLYFSIHSALGEPAGLRVTNGGLGPAIIKSFSLGVDNKWIDDTEKGGWVEASKLLGAEKFRPVLDLGLYSPDQILDSGESQYILETPKDKRTTDTDQYLNEFVKRLSVKIDYESAYKETFVATWKGERDIFLQQVPSI